MYLYLLMAMAGAIIGSRKNQNDNDLLQAGIGLTLGALVTTYLVTFLGILNSANLIGQTMASWMPGLMGVIFAPLIASVIGLIVYLAISFITAIFVRMK